MRYARIPHLVRAETLADAWKWQTSNGDVITAQPGDYRLTDPATGTRWSITATALTASYRVIDGDLYESRGQVSAERLPTGSRPRPVRTLEGDEHAAPGDWVVSDDLGNRWVVPDRWFREHYLAITELR
jgi:hypothetical protein